MSEHPGLKKVCKKKAKTKLHSLQSKKTLKAFRPKREPHEKRQKLGTIRDKLTERVEE